MKKISLIILNWNGKADALACLKSLRELRVMNYELRIIIVDNASEDSSVEEIHKKFPQVVILENNENLGFAEGNNVGIREALKEGADCIILLNNDTLVDNDLVEELLKAAESDPIIGVVSPKIYFAPGFEFHKDRYKGEDRGKVIWYAGGEIDWQNVLGSHRGVDEVDSGQYNKVEETNFATGCCMLVKREVFKTTGLLDKKYFLYYEDTDFCQRARRAGYKILYTPKAIVWHKNAASSDKPGSPTHVYYQTRNRLLFGFLYASLRTKMALFRESLRFLLEGGIKRKAVLDFYRGKFGQGRFSK
ncbi:MAG: glycosyltransferase family 2 protein [bacterium]|nr:glycosyltransferase family 2 protein [bacterium]